jgi:YfiH family protein
VRFTGRAEGDMGHAGEFVVDVRHDVASRRQSIADLPWTWLRQVHGDRVVRVGRPGERTGERADAAVTAERGCALAVLSADCAPVALVSSEGVVGAAHAGWAGVRAGVVEATVDAMRALGADDIRAVLGPCIRSECYAFGADDLDSVAQRLGPGVRGRTSDGRPALDLPAAVRSALQISGVGDLRDTGVCTACTPAYFSWRARRDRGRQVLVVWR